MAQHKALVLFKLNSHAKMAPDSGVEKHGLGEPGQSTSAPIGANNSFSKGRLMKTLLDGPQSVSTLDFRRRRRKAILSWKAERDVGAF
jgi:hypothetical protein